MKFIELPFGKISFVRQNFVRNVIVGNKINSKFICRVVRKGLGLDLKGNLSPNKKAGSLVSYNLLYN